MSQETVYDALTFHWQKSTDIRNKVIERTGKDYSLGKFYAEIHNLVDRGLAEKREVERTEEEKKARDNIPVTQYRKKATGKRNDDERDYQETGLPALLTT